MRRRPDARLRPAFDRFEPRRLPDGAGPAAAMAPPAPEVAPARDDAQAPRPAVGGLILNRITNPNPFNARLAPPFRQTLVQNVHPVAGETYNILYVSVRNSTARTFDASSGLAVRLTGQRAATPILEGDDRWTPGEVRVFYVLTKQYYPARPVTSAGFEFDLGGSRGVAIPGPSGIFLRVRYDPERIGRIIDWIVPRGPGSRGHRLGLPDTSIWEILPARADVIPL